MKKLTLTVSPGSTVPLVGDKFSELIRARSKLKRTFGGATRTFTEALLFAVLASASTAETVAESTSVPKVILVVVTPIVTVTNSPLARDGIEAVTNVLEATNEPFVELVEMTTTLSGKVSLMTTPVAMLGPRFVTRS